MKRLMMTLAAALVAMLMAAPVWATSNAYCAQQARNINQANGGVQTTDPNLAKWTGTRCVFEGQYQASDLEADNWNDRVDQADERRNRPDARAVYYGTPPAERGQHDASIGRNEICINIPSPPSQLTTGGRLRKIDVYAGDITREGEYWQDPVKGQSAPGIQSGLGHYVLFGTIELYQGMECVTAKGKLQGAVQGTEFPVELRPQEPERRVDATDPNFNCAQTQPNNDPTLSNQWNIGQCLQTHVAFRKMSHCAGLDGTHVQSAASCRIWVRVQP